MDNQDPSTQTGQPTAPNNQPTPPPSTQPPAQPAPTSQPTPAPAEQQQPSPAPVPQPAPTGGQVQSNPAPASQDKPANTDESLQSKFSLNMGTGPSYISPKIIGIALIIVIIIGAALYLTASRNIFSGSSTTILATTSTITQSTFSPISNCTTVSKGGIYKISGNIKTAITSGACINVIASNVVISCSNSQLVGSGPFVGIPPFTYAILVNRTKNVSIIGCTIRNFSYGVYAISSNSLSISNSNLSINYVSNIYLGNVHNGSIMNNYLSKSSSTEGSLYITNGTSGMQIINNTIRYNQYYGISINASNNTFKDNLINGTQYSLSCSVPNGLVTSSKAYSNLCYNNTGCAFMQCRGINVPPNISSISLTSKINSCGSVISPGTYQLGSSLNMRSFVNTSNPLSILNPCITIKSKNVIVNCNGLDITNATTGIIVDGKRNITIMNCRITNALNGGIALYNVSQAHLSNITLTNDSLGVQLYNTSVTALSNITATRNNYGIYLTASFANNFQGLNISYNNYGVFMQSGSISNNFNKDLIMNDSKLDIYASPDSANASINLMQSTTCGSTNAQWANCDHFVSTALPYVPISSCESISSPGNYLLTSSIFIAQQKCMAIDSNNVHLSCDNHVIASGSTDSGTGFYIAREKNVSISNCGIINFMDALNVSGSTLVNLSNLSIQGGHYGVILKGGAYYSLVNSKVNSTYNASVDLINSTNSRIINNSLTYGSTRGVGILLNSSFNNRIADNNATSEYVGIEFDGRSLNNTVVNNTVSGSAYTDFLCYGSTGGIGAQAGGLNFATKKLNCYWLATLLKSDQFVSCTLSQNPDFITISQDAEYTAGTACLTIRGSSSTINCMGHTIIATDGGTFAAFTNSQNSRIENCVLKGFTAAIEAQNSSVTVFNNTVYSSAGGFAINVTGSSASIKLNNISASGGSGIHISNAESGSLINNYVSNASLAYLISNSVFLAISNNTATASTGGGMLLANSTQNQFMDNIFLSRTVGLQCVDAAQGQSNNTDQGQNSCINEMGCNWIRASAQSCP